MRLSLDFRIPLSRSRTLIPEQINQVFRLCQSQNKINKQILNHVISILKNLSLRDLENKAKRVISIGQLNALQRLHTQPIKLVVYKHP